MAVTIDDIQELLRAVQDVELASLEWVDWFNKTDSNQGKQIAVVGTMVSIEQIK